MEPFCGTLSTPTGFEIEGFEVERVCTSVATLNDDSGILNLNQFDVVDGDDRLGVLWIHAEKDPDAADLLNLHYAFDPEDGDTFAGDVAAPRTGPPTHTPCN